MRTSQPGSENSKSYSTVRATGVPTGKGVQLFSARGFTNWKLFVNLGHAMLPYPQILGSEPLKEVDPWCWCIGREELKILKSESCPHQFLISQTRRRRFREGKGLAQCHMIWFDDMSTGLGLRSLRSSSNWCTCLCYAHWSVGSPQVPGNAVVPRAILLPDLDSSRDAHVLVLQDNRHALHLSWGLFYRLFFETWHVGNLSGQLWGNLAPSHTFFCLFKGRARLFKVLIFIISDSKL